MFIMVIMPLQTAWSVVVGLHGHMGDEVVSVGMHAHEHHHDEGGHADHDLAATVDNDRDHNEDDHHLSHYHPVFTYIHTEPALTLGTLRPDGPSPLLNTSFISHTPPLFERPPLAHA